MNPPLLSLSANQHVAHLVSPVPSPTCLSPLWIILKPIPDVI